MPQGSRRNAAAQVLKTDSALVRIGAVAQKLVATVKEVVSQHDSEGTSWLSEATGNVKIATELAQAFNEAKTSLRGLLPSSPRSST